MSDLTLPPFAAMVTREVRWFYAGPIPESVLDWFTSASAEIGRELRKDCYDADFAREGVGMKRRGTSTIDVKIRVMVTGAVDVAPAMRGSVEDWLKTSSPVSDASDAPGHHHLDVKKCILTRRYANPGVTTSEAGCEAGLVGITVGDTIAWSLCFETFGRPEDRFVAFGAGIRMFLADTPLPDGLAFSADESCGYPDWITGLALPA